MPLYRLDQLAHDFRPFGIAEIQIVGRRQRLGAGRGQIAPAFGDSLLAAFVRVGLAVARRHVGGEGQRLGGMALDAHDAGVAARNLQRIALDQRVVLLPDPAAAGKVRPAEHFQQRVGDIGLRDVVAGERLAWRRLDPWPVIFRRLVAEILDRQVGDFLALMDDAEAQIVGGVADDGEIEPPFAEDRLGFFFLFRTQHHQHALLAFREHHLIGGHALFAHRHLVEVEFDAEVALGAHFDGRAGEAGGAHVLDGDDRARRHQFEAGFEQAFFRERIADLNGRPLLLDLVVEFGRRHGRAADAVAAGLGAEIDDRQADALGLRQEDRVGLGEAGGEGVDQAVAVVAWRRN